MGAIKREMGSFKWTAFAIGYMTAFAYATCFSIYQIGSLFEGEFYWYEPITATAALVIIGVVIYFMARKNPYEKIKEKI